MSRAERAAEMLERAESLGLRLEFDCGLVVMKRTAKCDANISALMAGQLMDCFSEVYDLLKKNVR
jgi:hypothetical protein